MHSLCCNRDLNLYCSEFNPEQEERRKEGKRKRTNCIHTPNCFGKVQHMSQPSNMQSLAGIAIARGDLLTSCMYRHEIKGEG